MTRLFIIFCLMFVLITVQASAATFYTEEQILNKAFDPLTNKLKTDSEVTFGDVTVTIETPTGMSSNTINAVGGTTTEITLTAAAKTILMQNNGDYDVKYIVNANTGTNLATIKDGMGVSFDMVVNKIYVVGTTGTSEVQIDAWR